MLKYIIVGILVFFSTVSVAVAVPLLALKNQPPVASAAKSTYSSYLHTLSTSEKEKYITTSLADGRLVRVQLILELDSELAPKDSKNPGRDFLILQDTLLQTLRSCRSSDLEPQNQAAFKSKIAASAAKVFGKRSVHSVYIGSIAFQ